MYKPYTFRNCLLAYTAFAGLLVAAGAAQAACPPTANTADNWVVSGGSACTWTPPSATIDRTVGWTSYITVGESTTSGGSNVLTINNAVPVTFNITPRSASVWGFRVISAATATNTMTVGDVVLNVNAGATPVANVQATAIEVTTNGRFTGGDVTINLGHRKTDNLFAGSFSYGVLAGGSVNSSDYDPTAMAHATFDNLTITANASASSGGYAALMTTAAIRAIAQTDNGSGHDSGSGTVTVSGMTTINTSGTYSIGIYVSGRDSTVDINDSSITTSGSTSSAIRIGKTRDAGNGGGLLISRGRMEIDTTGAADTGAILLLGDGGINASYRAATLDANFDASSTRIQSAAEAVFYTVNDKGTYGNSVGSTASFNNAVMTTTSTTASLIKFESGTSGGTTYAQTDAVFNLRGAGSLLTAASDGWLFEAMDRTSATASISQGAVVQGMVFTGATNANFTMNLSDSAVWELVAKGTTATSTLTALNLASGARVDASGGDFTIAAAVASDSGILDLRGTTSTAGRTLLIDGAYTASGAAMVRMNTVLNAGGALADQTTDRLIVNGNATGTTLVSVQNAGGAGAVTSADGANRASEGISLVQVGGTAAADSFKLAGDYVSVDGTYQYRLYAYGQGSANGPADAAQNLTTAIDGQQWDYRLQSARYADLEPPRPPVPVPEIPAYMTLGNALFNAGMMNLDNLHRRLGEIRDDRRLGRDTGTGDAFLRAFGGQSTYHSNRSMHDYGYDADIDYAAVQLGGNLFSRRTDTATTRFGLAATFGELWMTPDTGGYGSSKANLNTYNIALYATYQADSGFYVDGSLGFGLFDGDVSAGGDNGRQTGKVSDVRGNSFAASLEAGRPFELGLGGLFLEPQVQLVYQHLSFDRTRDLVGGTPVNIDDQDQLIGRLGARLGRSFAVGEGQLVTPYAKVNVLHGFIDNGGVDVGVAGTHFDAGRYGTTLQVGGGVTATLTQSLSLYADGVWQTDVGNSGFRGWMANGGLRVTF